MADKAAARNRSIIAQEDTNLFGGSFTPFRDLWNAVAGDLGITTKRMRNQALAQAAEEESIWRDTTAQLKADIGRQRALAGSPEDVETLRTFETQLDRANRMRQSSNPDLAKAGISLLGKIMDEQRAFAGQQEVQRINAESAAAANERELGKERWDRFSGLYDDLHRESQDFLTIQGSYRALQAAYSGEGEPGNAQDIAAINSIQRMIDPGVSVREGDVSLLMNYAGVPDILVTAANRVTKNGGRFTAEERRAMVALGRELMVGANQKQAETNVRFQSAGQAGELPAKYVSELLIPLVDTGSAGALNFGAPTPTGDASITGEETPSGVMRDTITGIGDMYQGARRGVANTLEALDGLGGGGEGGEVPSSEPLSGLRNWARRNFPTRAERARRPVND